VAPSAPVETGPVLAGLLHFAQWILTDDGTPLGNTLPAGLRAALEAGLPLITRQLRNMDDAELARGLRFFAENLTRIADGRGSNESEGVDAVRVVAGGD